MKNAFFSTIPFFRRAQKSFTLVELLIVISIIAVLASLAFVGGTAAHRTALKAETQALMTTMKVGVSSYQNEYGKFPTPQGQDEDIQFVSDKTEFKDMIAILMGTNTTETFENANPRQIAFCDFPNKAFEGSSSSYKIMAPRFSGDRKPIRILLDYDYDNKITKDAFQEMSTDTLPKEDVRGSIHLWCQGSAVKSSEMKSGDLISTWK